MAHRLREKGVGNIGNHHADDIRSARDQRTGKDIRTVIELRRRPAHALACALGERNILSVEDHGDRCRRHPRTHRHILDGHFFPDCLHTLIPFSLAYAIVSLRTGMAHCAPRLVTVIADDVLANRIAVSMSAPSDSRVTNAPT